MKNFMKKWKQDPVLSASFLLAVASMLIVKPSREYLSYIDFRVLGILLSLMIVMAGFQENGFFDLLGGWLLQKCKTVLQLCLVLVFLCFFLSMLITNDVALITFVPFAIMTLKRARKERLYIPVIISQTLAANLGSMLTPLGNPQNLYLYNLAGFSVVEFVRILLPYTVAAGILLLLLLLVITKNVPQELKNTQEKIVGNQRGNTFWKNAVYLVMFLCCLLVVFRLVSYLAVLVLILAGCLIFDRQILKKVDVSLLFTFVFFFIFTGNLGQLEAVKEYLGSVISGNEVLVGVIASQFISNVPATLLLSGFTQDYRALLIGVDLGGLGTLIASMASLISYKLYAEVSGARKGTYIGIFSLCNILFLIIFLAMYYFIR